MSKNAFHHRAQILEDEFFHRVDQELIRKLQQQYEREADEDALVIATGIEDRKLLDALLAVQITPKSLAALSLFPAVYVAWADGHIEIAERKAVLQAAHDHGIIDTSAAYELLESWLHQKPQPELFSAWSGFIHAARHTLSVSAFRELRESAMHRADHIAEAAGGILGLGKVSAAEKAALAELDHVFVEAAATEEPAAATGLKTDS